MAGMAEKSREFLTRAGRFTSMRRNRTIPAVARPFDPESAVKRASGALPPAVRCASRSTSTWPRARQSAIAATAPSRVLIAPAEPSDLRAWQNRLATWPVALCGVLFALAAVFESTTWSRCRTCGVALVAM
jgi:hypothetical protein